MPSDMDTHPCLWVPPKAGEGGVGGEDRLPDTGIHHLGIWADHWLQWDFRGSFLVASAFLDNSWKRYPSNWSQSCYKANSWMTPRCRVPAWVSSFCPARRCAGLCLCGHAELHPQAVPPGQGEWVTVAVMWFVANTELTAILMSGGWVVLE